MAGSPAGKPYAKALIIFPKHKAEIMVLPQKYCQVISKFPYKAGCYGIDEEDYFDTLVLLCLEADQEKTTRRAFQAQANLKINAELEKRKRETQKFYNPFNNLYLDKCYGDSKAPLGTWMNFSSEDE